MCRYLLLLLITFTSCRTADYYIVRHAEKEAPGAKMSTDVPLSDDGVQRSLALKDSLKSRGIVAIYSTKTIRTRSTAQPLATELGLEIRTYDHKDSAFVPALLKKGKGNILIVGHSNTVDDLVNNFLGRKELQDLPDSSYGDLFIIRQKGKKVYLERGHFGD